jgi:hypothetical protein
VADAIRLSAAIVVVASAIGFLAISVATFAAPDRVRRFFEAFASSARTHFAEQAFRLVFGVALVLHAPSMWQPLVFRVVGWTIVVTAVLLCCVPWRWHHRFAQRVMPTVYRHLRLFGVAVAAFAVLLLIGVVAGAGEGLRGSP